MSRLGGTRVGRAGRPGGRGPASPRGRPPLGARRPGRWSLRWGVAAAAALLLALVADGPARALVGDLTPEEVREAIAAGTASLTQEDFADEWRIALPDGGEIVVSTPFSRLALAARQAAIKGEPLTERQQQEQIDRGKGRIQLLVTMHGARRDFARWYQPVLLVDGREVKATFAQNERTPLRLEDGRFAARNVYVFPLEGLPLRGTVTLVVRGAPPESREALRAAIDLSRFR
ncbi:MAG TPA: hypothetical protein VFC42_14135 [Methylomirabilota bacterium]|nr:hypothetical protein [Methylomirabilota bacterium]